MEQNKKTATICTVNPNLQGKKYKLTAESKAFLEKGQMFLREKVKELVL
ncbi:hypothetical protein LV89_03175 [Arcicella aurantiaca]|uniref:Uncharacterized protein n=1 Tax=Arcicella aurantiaca TaxID=591202 RepID=A0A316E0Z6_9BACT|nr:hypothetical protein [Arcicella aurantiaca]PWK23358.1 hypothetical protein LV89_03175 [Arcicella aurantiaca]